MHSVCWSLTCWILWLIPIIVVAASDLTTCNRKWIKMNDRNYNKAIRHYAECVLLGQALDPPARQRYQANIIMNLKKTCNYFFDRSSLSTSNLIGVVREMAKILEGFDEDMISQPKSYYRWNAAKNGELPSGSTPCPDDAMTRTMCVPVTPPTMDQTTECSSLKERNASGYLVMVFLFILLLILIQAIFISWFCCCNNCMCLEFCKTDAACTCDHDASKEELRENTQYCTNEPQHDLASLSSDNVGSDSEFEALLRMNKLPKEKRQGHNKEVD